MEEIKGGKRVRRRTETRNSVTAGSRSPSFHNTLKAQMAGVSMGGRMCATVCVSTDAKKQ